MKNQCVGLSVRRTTNGTIGEITNLFPLNAGEDKVLYQLDNGDIFESDKLIIQSLGKFEGETLETIELYEYAMVSSQDCEISVGEGAGWYGRFNDELAIIHEDSNGFVSTSFYDNLQDLNKDWQELEDLYNNDESEDLEN